MKSQTLRRSCVALLSGALLFAAGCDQRVVEPSQGAPSLSVQFATENQNAAPQALVRIVERVRQLSLPGAPGRVGLGKSLGFLTPNEGRIAVLDATQWKSEEELLSALAGESDTLYNYGSVNPTKDLWDNMVSLFKGYTGSTYRFAGEYYLPVLYGASRGIIAVNPGINMFFAALREDRRTVYLYFTIQRINAEGENVLFLSPLSIVQRLLDHVGSWDPANGWRAMDGGINGEVLALELVDAYVVAGGSFSTAGSVGANNIAAFDTASRRWLPMGPGLGGPVTALAVHNKILYALSNSRLGVTPQSSGLFRWTGSGWAQVGPTFAGHGYALNSDGARLYVGGNFASAGAGPLNNVGFWTDTSTTFSPLLGGTNGTVYTITSYVAGAPLIFMGGLFTSVGTVPPTAVGKLARWDTRSWTTIGAGAGGGVSGPASVVRTVLFSGGVLYVGGFFSQADVTPVNNVALYNGNTWAPMGLGLDGLVRVLASDGVYIYAGGTFRTTQGYEVNNIAAWNGSGWGSLDMGLDGPVNAIRPTPTVLYVGGAFRYSK